MPSSPVSREGTVRVSPGFFNTKKEIELFFEAIRKIAKKVWLKIVE